MVFLGRSFTARFNGPRGKWLTPQHSVPEMGLNALLMAVVMTLSVSSGVFAADTVFTPKPGSNERKQVIEPLRGVVEKELKKPVVFRIEALKMQKDWAFLRGVILEKSGKPMDYRGTPYQEAIDAGTFDDWFCALLHKEGRRWRVLTHSIGATDAPFVDWAERYHAPPGIFK